MLKSFDDSALTQLTASIEKKLGGKPDWENKKPEHGGKRKRQDGPATDNPNNEPLKKRPARKGPGDRAKAAQPAAKPAKTSAAALLEEIRALGGDENDLELIENVDSDAEEGQGAKKAKDAEEEVDDKFKDELAKFAASLGLEKLRQEVEEESEAEEEAEEAAEPDEEDDAEAEEEEEEEEEPQPPAHSERPEPPTREERSKDAHGKLVSKPLYLVSLSRSVC